MLYLYQGWASSPQDVGKRHGGESATSGGSPEDRAAVTLVVRHLNLLDTDGAAFAARFNTVGSRAPAEWGAAAERLGRLDARRPDSD